MLEVFFDVEDEEDSLNGLEIGECRHNLILKMIEVLDELLLLSMLVDVEQFVDG